MKLLLKQIEINYGDKLRLRFTGSVLQQKTIIYSHKKVVNLNVVYEITNFHDIDNYPKLTNALFGAVKLTKNADIDKYKYFGYGIGFDGKGFFHMLVVELEEM